jgi:enoyl-CoA hydratase/carnithine racemase
MTGDAIRIEDRDRIRRIVIDRPGKANALTAAMMHALADALRGGSHTGMIMLEGRSERGFSAGTDIAEFLQGGENLQRQEEGLRTLFRPAPKRLGRSLRRSTAHARRRRVAGGVVRLVIAADNLMFGLPEIRFNMYPVIVHAVLEEKISPALAFQLCASGPSTFRCRGSCPRPCHRRRSRRDIRDGSGGPRGLLPE